MKINTTTLGQYFRYGFIPDNPADLHFPEYRRNTRDSILTVLESRFYIGAQKIKKLSEKTKRDIFLGLSGGIDSLLIYKVFTELGLNFKGVNLRYGNHYDETKEVIAGIGHIGNILFVNKDVDPQRSIRDSGELLHPNIISHPTVIAYSDIATSIPKGSILVTGDLGDEIFGDTDGDLIPCSPLPEYVFDKGELGKVFPGVHFTHIDTIVHEQAHITELLVIFQKVTYSMWQNVTKKRNILYIPFYRYFLDMVPAIKEQGINSHGKNFLYNLGESYSLDKKQLTSSGIKFPIDQDMNRIYFSYISEQQEKFHNLGLSINIDYLESLLDENPQEVKWKLFSLLLFINYTDRHENRFFDGTKE